MCHSKEGYFAEISQDYPDFYAQRRGNSPWSDARSRRAVESIWGTVSAQIMTKTDQSKLDENF